MLKEHHSLELIFILFTAQTTVFVFIFTYVVSLDFIICFTSLRPYVTSLTIFFSVFKVFWILLVIFWTRGIDFLPIFFKSAYQWYKNTTYTLLNNMDISYLYHECVVDVSVCLKFSIILPSIRWNWSTFFFLKQIEEGASCKIGIDHTSWDYLFSDKYCTNLKWNLGTFIGYELMIT